MDDTITTYLAKNVDTTAVLNILTGARFARPTLQLEVLRVGSHSVKFNVTGDCDAFIGSLNNHLTFIGGEVLKMVADFADGFQLVPVGE